MAKRNYVERALFVMGDQNTGKSTQLRSMFRDWRFGRLGEIPNASNVPNSYQVGNDRRVYLRLTSPHEAGETMRDFLDKCANEMASFGGLWYRWNFAGALQISATAQLPSGKEVIHKFINKFMPERVRVVILSPFWSGTQLDPNVLHELIQDLWLLPKCEVMVVDATSRTANGLIYADFFDFT